jgi:hypothetical protein
MVATPVKVGRFVGSDGRPVLLVTEDVSFGTVAVVVPVVPDVIEIFVPVLVTALVLPVFVATVVLPFVCVTVERLGRSDAAGSCADAPTASSETAKAVEMSDVFRKALMLIMLFNCYTTRSRCPWTRRGARYRAVRSRWTPML